MADVEKKKMHLIQNSSSCWNTLFSFYSIFQVAFEGKWTRNTHPRNYPSDWWSTKFSDIIGTSHNTHYAFWNEQDYASDGMKIMAETGNTTELESEIKKNVR